MSENQDDFGDDTAEEGLAVDNAKHDGRESKPNRAKKPGAKPVVKPETPPHSRDSEEPAPVLPVVDNFTPRARALQAKAADKAKEMKRRLGQTLKCPGCQVVLHVDKTLLDARKVPVARWLFCKNPKCSYKENTGRVYRKQVSMSANILNDEEDLGVMSDRQRAHMTPAAETN